MNRLVKLAIGAVALLGIAGGLAGCDPGPRPHQPDIIIEHQNPDVIILPPQEHHHRPDVVIVPPVEHRPDVVIVNPRHDEDPPVVIPSKRRPSIDFGSNSNDDPPLVIPHR